MSIWTIEFRDTESDLATLGHVCRDLEGKGVPPGEAAAHVLASMANQAIANGMDSREVIDALHQVITGKTEPDAPVQETKRTAALTPQQAEELRERIKFLQNFLLYWDIILCSEIQRHAYLVKEELERQGMYRHELKKFANTLTDEARRLQIRVKDNDRALVLKWCSRLDEKGIFAKGYHADGGSVVSRFVLSFRREFDKEWRCVELDCRTVAKRSPKKISDIVTLLLKVEALTNTGIELYDTCVKKMKMLVAGHGKASITKSLHHESMRCACWGLLRKLGVNMASASDTERTYARKHLFDLQLKMANVGMGDFFQKEFDGMTEEFADYMIARMRMGMQAGDVPVGAIRFVFGRLGTKHRVKKFFLQLAAVRYPDGADADVFDVADAVAEHEGNRSEINRLRKMCLKGERFELPESEDKLEQRMLRILARRNGYMLPDDILRVMIMKHKTKTLLMQRLKDAGFELAPTLRRVRKLKVAELKQL